MKKIFNLAFLTLIFFLSWTLSIQAQTYTIKYESEEIYQEIDGSKCGVFTGCSVAGEPIEINFSNMSYSTGEPLNDGDLIEFKVWAKGTGCENWPAGVGPLYLPIQDGNLNTHVPGAIIKTGCQYSVELYRRTVSNEEGPDDNVKQFKYNSPYSPPAQASCTSAQCNEDLGISGSSTYELCAQINKSTDQYAACLACFDAQGIWTAVGCIPSSPESVIKVVITIGLALGGGVVLIMILVGSFMLSVSQGDPNKTKEAKEIITSAIIGLLFVIFSVTILQFIGVSILHIPGFGE